jgi:hypothetical protein
MRQAPAEIFISRFTAWAPGFTNPADWTDWARGGREIPETREGPSLEFTDPLFRRRLSQISRMVIQVIHDLLPIADGAKITLVSFHGEITQQIKVNKTLVTERQIMPAVFSLSVYNAPVALATIALKLDGLRYTTVFPMADNFSVGFASAAASLADGAEEAVLVYADELFPSEYNSLRPARKAPLAFAALLSEKKSESSIPAAGASMESPQAFLKSLMLHQELYR